MSSGKEYTVVSSEKRGGLTLYTMEDGTKIGHRDLRWKLMELHGFRWKNVAKNRWISLINRSFRPKMTKIVKFSDFSCNKFENSAFFLHFSPKKKTTKVTGFHEKLLILTEK